MNNPHSFRDTMAWIVNTDPLTYWMLVGLARVLVYAQVVADKSVQRLGQVLQDEGRVIPMCAETREGRPVQRIGQEREPQGGVG